MGSSLVLVLFVALVVVGPCVAIVWVVVRHLRRVSAARQGVAALAPTLGLTFAPRDPWGLERIGASLLPSGAEIKNVSFGYVGSVAVAVGWWETVTSFDVSDAHSPTFHAGTIAFAGLPADRGPCLFVRRGNRYEVTPGQDALADRLVPVLLEAPLPVDAEVRGRWLIVRPQQPGIYLTYNPLDPEPTGWLLECARRGAVVLGSGAESSARDVFP